MSLFYPKDYGLTANQLQVRHERKDPHPGYPQMSWRAEVQLGNTEAGYWEWVREQLEAEQAELDACNPYN